MLGPIPTNPTQAMTPGENIAWGLFVSSTLVVVIIVSAIRNRKRSKTLRHVVNEHEWKWWNQAVPSGLPVRELIETSGRTLTFRNAFSGKRRNKEFVVFDCVVGQGKGKRTITAVAVRSETNPFGAERFSSDYTVTHSQGWYTVSRTPDFLHTSGFSPYELIALIDSIN